MSDDSDRGYDLAYREASRWLDDQRTRLDTLRSRIGTLFAAANIVGGFLLAQIFSKDRTHHITWPGRIGITVAAAALAFMCVVLVWLWKPRSIAVNLKPATIIGGYVESDPARSYADMQRNIALYMGKAADKNNDTIESLQRWFSAAAICFLVGVFGLGLALWDVLT